MSGVRPSNSLTMADLFTKEGFNNIIVNEDGDRVFMRTNAKNEEEVEKWKNIYCKWKNISLNVFKNFGSFTKHKLLFRKTYMCLHGDRRHTGIRKEYTGCEFKVDFRIRRVTKSTVKRDKLMKEFPCFITIHGGHNHSLASTSALQQLRILPQTREEFFKYFEMGMTTAQATRFHQEKMEFDVDESANRAINPSSNSVSWLRDVWLKQHGDGGHNMFSLIKKYAHEIGSTAKLELEVDRDHFTVVLVTDFMMRVHKKIEYSRQVVLVETTSHADQMNTSITPLLCAGPAGAVPLGVVFTSGQDEMSYRRGFQLLKKTLGAGAFYGQGYPDCFITDNCEAERLALKEVWPDSALYLCRKQIRKETSSSSDVKEIEKVNAAQFKVRCVSKKDVEYNVDMHSGICDCAKGHTGGICQHQIACSEKYLHELLQDFKSASTSQQCHSGVAHGQEISSNPEFQSESTISFSPITTPSIVSSEIKTDQDNHDVCNNIESIYEEITNFETQVSSDDDFIHESPSTSGHSQADKVKVLFDLLKDKIDKLSDNNTSEALEKAIEKTMKYCISSNSLNTGLSTIFSPCMDKVGTGGGRGKILCQPTSIARRKPDEPRGVTPVRRERKRKRSLLMGKKC